MVKKVIPYTYIIFLLPLLSCDKTDFDCIKKAGSTTTITLPLPPFHSININDGINVIIKEGDMQEVKLTAGKNLMSAIKVAVDSSGFVNISNENTCNWMRSYKDINLHITLDTLARIYHYGYGDLTSEGILHFSDFSVNVKDGSGDVHLNIDNKKLHIVSNTIANFHLSGKTDSFIAGFYYNDGMCKAKDLQAKKVSIIHLGINTIEVTALESLTGSIQSTGDIVYHGNPEEVAVSIAGDGKLIKR